MDKLPDMRLKNPVFAVYDIEVPGMSRLVQRKKKYLFCFFQIQDRTGGEYGYPQSVDNGF